MLIFRFLAATVLAIFLLPSLAAAHALNQSYVYFQVKEDAITGRIDITFDDINQTVMLDTDGDGVISVEEFQAKTDEAFAAVTKGLKLRQEGRELQIRSTGFDSFGGGFPLNGAHVAQMSFDIIGLEGVPETLEVTYAYLYNDIDPTHTGYALIEENFRTGIAENESFVSLIFTTGDETQDLSLTGASWVTVFANFIVHGIWHIWIGHDHILFLVSLLISSVMILRAGGWEPRETFGDAFWEVLKIVTLFTIAHTITLSLAALGLVSVPPALIEFIIALSIAVMALDNIFPIFHRRAWLIILAFGLIHGFGFANVLAPLGIDPQHQVVTLAAFNIGVEIGQAAIVIVLFPLLFMIRKYAFYKPVVMTGLSCVLIAIALYWAFERSPEVVEGIARILERGTLTPGG